MPEIICNKCGSVDDFRVELKSNNQVAYCNSCGAYIKNIPYAEPSFYFGRYKGMKVSDLIDVKDVPYLEWYLLNIQKITPSMKDAIANQIQKINNGS